MDVNLQLALDFGDIDEALQLAKRVEEYVDWIEAGTPLIVGEAIRAVTTLKESFPDKIVVADLKIIDGGGPMSKLAFTAGADVVTVLGHAADVTICKAVEQAKRYGTKVLVDMLNIPHVAARVQQVELLGVDYIGIHTAWDTLKLGNNPLQGLQVAARVATLPLVVAGGVNLDTIDAVMCYKPTTIIVGTGITMAKDPRGVAKLLRERMKVNPSFKPPECR